MLFRGCISGEHDGVDFEYQYDLSRQQLFICKWINVMGPAAVGSTSARIVGWVDVVVFLRQHYVLHNVSL